jgi:cytochrome o ubiquinol oxidase operon protein cyoD
MIKNEGKLERRLYGSYIIGFVLSLALTIAAFSITTLQVQSGNTAYPSGLLVGGLAGLAIAQLIVQLLFFFHLGREAKPRLNTVSFLFMLMVVGIIGFGSLWIMYNLNYNMMPREVETYIQNEENIQLDKLEHHHDQ